MPLDLGLYSRNSIRERLAPRLLKLMDVAGASRCALLWSSGNPPGEFHPYLTLDRGRGGGLIELPKGFAGSGRRESVTGRLRGGQTRSKTCAGMFITERDGRSWFVALQAKNRLTLGRSVGRFAELAYWGALSSVARIEHVEPTRQLDARALLTAGESAEEASSFDVAITLYARANEVALSTGDAEVVVRSGWYQGRALRKMAQWDEALAWYERALGIATSTAHVELAAVIGVGVANILWNKGDLPSARGLYEKAAGSGIPEAETRGFAGLMLIATKAGDLNEARRCGWQAVRHAESDEDRTVALGGLADVFLELGFGNEAELTNRILLNMPVREENRMIAIHNLSHIYALRGDEEGYEYWRRQIDKDSVSIHVLVAFHVEDAQSLLALGKDLEGLSCYRTAVRLGEQYKTGQLLFQAESELEAAVAAQKERPDPPSLDRESREIRAQLKEMYAELAT